MLKKIPPLKLRAVLPLEEIKGFNRFLLFTKEGKPYSTLEFNNRVWEIVGSEEESTTSLTTLKEKLEHLGLIVFTVKDKQLIEVPWTRILCPAYLPEKPFLITKDDVFVGFIDKRIEYQAIIHTTALYVQQHSTSVEHLILRLQEAGFNVCAQ